MSGRSNTDGGGIGYRLATDDDLPACAAIWHRGISDYQGRLNIPTFPLDLEPVRRLLAHLRSTDPALFWLAVRGGAAARDGERILGFGSAYIRGSVWFLAMLFVDPTEQARGIGRELLLRTFPGGAPPDPHGSLVLATATDSAQPISNGLYALYGMVPRLPVFQLVGRPAPGVMPRLPAEVRASTFQEFDTASSAGLPGASGQASVADALNAIDRTILRYEHPVEHRWFQVPERQGFMYQLDGRAVGYAYTSSVGRVGPIASLDAGLLPAIAGHVLEAVVPRGASSIRITGASTELFSGLLRAGLRIEELPTLMCWTRPFADFARYVPNSLAVI